MITFDYLSSFIVCRMGSDRGASLVEYALLVALIAIVCMAAITVLGQAVSSTMSSVSSSID
jgi:pilus assembly protein Flp/PilA